MMRLALSSRFGRTGSLAGLRSLMGHIVPDDDRIAVVALSTYSTLSVMHRAMFTQESLVDDPLSCQYE